jgi:hypothetical protein
VADADKPEQDEPEVALAGSAPAASAGSSTTTTPATSSTSAPAPASAAQRAPAASTTAASTGGGRRRGAAAAVKKTTSTVRFKLASLLWLVAVVCALFLAVGALLVALKANQDNAIVLFVLDGADTLDLDVFSRDDGVFTFDKDRDGVKSALVNWGLAALAYLVVGKIVDRVVRP